MHRLLNHNLYLVKEHLGLLKAANNYDIYDPSSGEVLLHCREPKLGIITKILRFTEYKRMTPFDVRITTPAGEPVVGVSRGVAMLLSRVSVRDERDQIVGGFKQKLLSIGGKFDVLDESDQPVCTLRGKWTGWQFHFVAGDVEFAHVTKKWSGIGKEMFTSADTYMLKISDIVEPDNPVRQLILAAVMCIDMILKE